MASRGKTMENFAWVAARNEHHRPTAWGRSVAVFVALSATLATSASMLSVPVEERQDSVLLTSAICIAKPEQVTPAQQARARRRQWAQQRRFSAADESSPESAYKELQGNP